MTASNDRNTSEPCCGSCHWWVPEAPGVSASPNDHQGITSTGACHVEAPQMVATGLGALGYWPVTHRSRFCREWQPGSAADAEANVFPFTPKGAA